MIDEKIIVQGYNFDQRAKYKCRFDSQYTYHEAVFLNTSAINCGTVLDVPSLIQDDCFEVTLTD
jgi:hypothetical protein